VQGGSKQKFHVDDMLKCISTDKVSLKLVHRIDKDTSGLLLLAKENKVAKKFTSFFKDRKIIKTYLAIVSPCPNDDRGTIDLPLSKSGTKGYQRMSVDQNMGKRAITEYKVLDKVGSRVALVALFPKTGRTHQLRVHLEYINAPIVGDNKYRGLSEVYMSSQNLPEHKKLSQIKWIPNNIKNLQLHAYSIRIPESETITAEVSEDFKQNLKFLGLKLPKKLHDIFI
jgi:RluA family pseudouridine synthase